MHSCPAFIRGRRFHQTRLHVLIPACLSHGCGDMSAGHTVGDRGWR